MANTLEFEHLHGFWYYEYVLNSSLLIKTNVGKLALTSYLHSYSTRRRDNKNVPNCGLNRKMDSFHIISMRMINALPNTVRDLQTRDFKRILGS